jgi:hypothetical protein
MSIDKVNILNMVKNIVEPNRAVFLHVFKHWKASICERGTKHRLVSTPYLEHILYNRIKYKQEKI